MPCAWLFRAANHLHANRCRTEARRRNLLARHGHRFALGPEGDCDLQEIQSVVSALSEKDRRLLYLVAVLDLNHHAIGATLGIASSTVSVRLHRLRRLHGGKHPTG